MYFISKMSSIYGVPSSQPKYAKPIIIIGFIKGVKLKIDLDQQR